MQASLKCLLVTHSRLNTLHLDGPPVAGPGTRAHALQGNAVPDEAMGESVPGAKLP